jgi:hypothetical protein
MKKIVAIFMLAILYSCSCTCDEVTAADIAAQEEASTNDVEIIFTTTEPNYDEAMITYYDIDLATDVAEAYVFKYDTDGNPLPLKLIFDNYKYDFLDGEAFRNNFSTSELKVQVFVEGELLLERASNGNANEFARVNFSFDIP